MPARHTRGSWRARSIDRCGAAARMGHTLRSDIRKWACRSSLLLRDRKIRFVFEHSLGTGGAGGDIELENLRGQKNRGAGIGDIHGALAIARVTGSMAAVLARFSSHASISLNRSSETRPASCTIRRR